MKCPMCATRTTQVLDSRQTEHGAAVRRRRCCPKCDVRFTTYERIEQLVPVTVDTGHSELLARRGAFGLAPLRQHTDHDAPTAR